MNQLTIEKVTLKEAGLLQEISRQTFSDTFSAENKEANIRKYLEKNLSLRQLESELADPRSQFYFARMDKHVIGYLKLNTGDAQTEIRDEKGLEIERIYVLKEFFGKGISQLLFQKALEIAGNIKAEHIWLGVWEKNLRAIRFYEKQGFIASGKHIFKLGDEDQTDVMMKLSLIA